ncbi:MAG: hypothetical protein CW338_09475, partial [Clostridiales bacterium]|nr:hypothetical protein [Clostridiales bacterium]
EDAPFSVKKKVLNAPANGQFFVPGEIIRYEVDVTNTSSLTYNFIAIMDFAISPVNVADSTDPFAPGESMTCELEYTVTELDAFNGYAGNEAWACNEYGQKEVSNTVLSPCGWNKYDIEVIKDIISRPANEYYYTEGETVIFRIQVINRSTCPVSNVELYDMLIDNQLKAFAAGPFAPGETAIDICLPYTVTAFDVMMGHGGNVALAQIGDQPGGYYSNYVEFGCGEYAAPELTVTKEVVSRPGGGRSYYIEGEDVTYVITYTDTGNTDLYDVVVYDGLKQADLGVISTDILLHPGESRSVTYVYTVANYDVERGYLDNTARAEYGFFECETVVSNTVRVDTDGIPDPDIAPAVTGTKGSGGTASARSASGPEKTGDTVIPGVPGTSAVPGMTGGEDYCHADYSGGAAVLTFCPQHMETETAMAALNDPAAVRALWKQALNDEYAAWLSRCNGPAQAVLLTERAQFSAFLAVREQTLKLLYPDDQAAVDSIIAGMMREKVAVMCCELHTAPAPRAGLSAGVTGTGLTGRIDEMNAVYSSMSRYSGSDLTIFTVWLNARGDLLRVIWPGDESMAQAALEQDVLVNIRLLKELQ